MDEPGAYHHVVARGVEKRAIFLDDDDRSAFVVRLTRLLLELGFACLAWSLIHNHFHLLVRRDGKPLAKLMARLNGAFAQEFNRKYGRVGHLFQGRFVSRMITTDGDLENVAKYVLFNPARHRIVAASELREFRWCAYGAIDGARPAHAFERVDEVVKIFGGDLAAVRTLLRRELAALALEPSEAERLEALIQLACARAGIPRGSVGSRSALATRFREEVSAAAIVQLGTRPRYLARALGVSEAAVHRAMARASASQRKKGV